MYLALSVIKKIDKLDFDSRKDNVTKAPVNVLINSTMFIMIGEHSTRLKQEKGIVKFITETGIKLRVYRTIDIGIDEIKLF